MDINRIEELFWSILSWPFKSFRETIAAWQLYERRIYSISEFAKVSVEEVREFAKTHEISLEQIMIYTSCFRKMPDEKTADEIFRMGFSLWLRRKKKNYVNNSLKHK